MVTLLAGNKAARTMEKIMPTDKKKETPKKMWKIEGEAFEKVKAARKEYVAAKDEAHDKFWNSIHDAVPEADRDAHLSLDSSYEDAGFYVLKDKGDECGSGILGAILAAAKAS
jgi:hypothetical protein